MVLNICVSTTTCPKISFWSLRVQFWTPLILVDERLALAPCSFSHFHPIVTFRPPTLNKYQNRAQNGAQNRPKCHQNAIQDAPDFWSIFGLVFCPKMTPKMEPKMPLEPPFFESFFTCGPRPRPWPHCCPLLVDFGASRAPFWPHFAPFWPHFGPLFLPPKSLMTHV